jgi:phage baseplate assembly protein W
MPLERVSRSFKDISLSFVKNPATDDVTVLTNERAIARSVRNLITTSKGERFFQPELGSSVADLLFENMLDVNTLDVLKDEVKVVIEAYEPRVEIEEVIVIPIDGNNAVDIGIIYTIIGLDVPRQQLTFVFQPVR